MIILWCPVGKYHIRMHTAGKQRVFMRNKKSMFAAIIGGIAILAVVGGRYIYSEYHTYYSPLASEYETVAAEKGLYVLETQKKELLGSTYAAFIIKNRETGEIVYQCPDLFLVKELEQISWLDEGYDIEITVKEKGPVIYQYGGNDIWTRKP